MAIFLCFVRATPTTAWLFAKRCHVSTPDPNPRTLGLREAEHANLTAVPPGQPLRGNFLITPLSPHTQYIFWKQSKDHVLLFRLSPFLSRLQVLKYLLNECMQERGHRNEAKKKNIIMIWCLCYEWSENLRPRFKAANKKKGPDELNKSGSLTLKNKSLSKGTTTPGIENSWKFPRGISVRSTLPDASSNHQNNFHKMCAILLHKVVSESIPTIYTDGSRRRAVSNSRWPGVCCPGLIQSRC